MHPRGGADSRPVGVSANQWLNDIVDFTVAAAAQSIGARVVTLNVRHFPMFPGLEPAYR